MKETKRKIREFLSRFFRKHTLQDDDNIFELGFVNSLFAMQLIMFLENEFNIRVQDSDLDLNNFSTINSIAQFLDEKITLKIIS